MLSSGLKLLLGERDSVSVLDFVVLLIMGKILSYAAGITARTHVLTHMYITCSTEH